MNLLRNVLLSDRNTFRIGGKTSFYAEPGSEEEFKKLMDFADQNGLPVFILGKGSNVLISDYGWMGLTINTSSHFSNVRWSDECAVAEGGASLNTLINQSITYGFSGMEQLSGIPGTVGGAVIMNAGAFESCIADTFVSAEILLASGLVKTYSLDEAAFGYRASRFKNDGGVVFSATFKFRKTIGTDELKAVQKDVLTRRKSKQPIEYPNCGSVFKRPAGNFAGTLIEKCGLKGLMSGDMQVSEKHANFIINKGNGKAEDVRILIRAVQQRVYEHCGILLEPEVLFIGKFDEPLFKI
jgi:UDP-N-acetylmuramate dehydrogenase